MLSVSFVARIFYLPHIVTRLDAKQKSRSSRLAGADRGPRAGHNPPERARKAAFVGRRNAEKTNLSDRRDGLEKEVSQRVWMASGDVGEAIRSGFGGDLGWSPDEVGDLIFARVSPSEASSVRTSRAGRVTHFWKAPARRNAYNEL